MPKVNRQISTEEVRLIDENNQMLGIVKLADALRAATEKGFDLMEISPNATPPVCKIGDFSKYKYDLQKQSQTSTKKIKLKEIKFGVNIGTHDLDIKIKHINEFLEEGHLVRVTIMMKGRENRRKEVAIELMNKIVELLSVHGKIHDNVSSMGSNVIATFISNKKK